MKKNQLVSVIIPTYNRADQVGKAIQSVLHQTYKNIQVIVVDDGSCDNTRKVVTEQYPGVEYVAQPHARQAAARNRGLQHAKGSIVASLDSDDYWQPDFLCRGMAKLEANNLDFVFANWIQYTQKNDTRDYLRTYPQLAPYIEKAKDNWVNLNARDLKDIYLKGCPSPSSSALIRRSSIVSGWNNNLIIGDDWCLFLDMILRKPCRAAFCLDQLWTKNINAMNIYDGRAWNETTKLLYVDDLKKMIDRYQGLLSSDDQEDLEMLHLKGMMSLAIYHLFQKGDLHLSSKFIKDSFVLNAGRTLRLFPTTLKDCLNRKRNLVSFF